MVEAITGLTSFLQANMMQFASSTSSINVSNETLLTNSASGTIAPMGALPQDNNISTGGSNVRLRTQPSLHSASSSGSHVQSRTQPPPPNDDDMISLNASNIWYGGIRNRIGNNTNGDQEDELQSPPHSDTLNAGQEYWQKSIEDYPQASIDDDYGPEIISYIASASKMYWHKRMKEDDLETKRAEAKIPSNCEFLQHKKTNKEIFAVIPRPHRTNDKNMQEIQKIFAASATLMLKAASALTDLIPCHDDEKCNIMNPLNLVSSPFRRSRRGHIIKGKIPKEKHTTRTEISLNTRNVTTPNRNIKFPNVIPGF